MADPSPSGPSASETEKRRRVWESLPPEVRRDPKVRAKFADVSGDAQYFGLGDAVAAIAKPVARALGRDPNCVPCQQRQQRMNRIKLFRRKS
jgi:hypothetical protein